MENTTATCRIDGYIEVKSNGADYSFEYGICCSEGKTPSINDIILCKHLERKNLLDADSFSPALPENFTFEGLKEKTRYYYRAFFKGGLSSEVIYADEVFDFQTGDSIERELLKRLYYSSNGTN